MHDRQAGVRADVVEDDRDDFRAGVGVEDLLQELDEGGAGGAPGDVVAPEPRRCLVAAFACLTGRNVPEPTAVAVPEMGGRPNRSPLSRRLGPHRMLVVAVRSGPSGRQKTFENRSDPEPPVTGCPARAAR